MGDEEAQGYEVSADLQSLEDAHANYACRVMPQNHNFSKQINVGEGILVKCVKCPCTHQVHNYHSLPCTEAGELAKTSCKKSAGLCGIAPYPLCPPSLPRWARQPSCLKLNLE